MRADISGMHSALNDIVKRGLSAAHIPSRLEPTGLLRSDGKRPDGVTLAPWSSGCLLVWDATCPDTFAISYRAQATSESGRVAESAEDRKAEKYRGLPASHSFTPVAIETLGAIGPRSMLFLREGLPWSLVSHGPQTISCSDCQWRCRGGTQPQCRVAWAPDSFL